MRLSSCGRGVREHGVLDLLELVGDEVEDREVVVDQRVDHQVVDEVDAAPEQRRVALEPLPHVLERGDRRVVHGHQVVLAQEGVQLVPAQLFQVVVGHWKPCVDQEHVVPVLLGLGALV